MTNHLGRSVASYSVPLPPAAPSLTEGLSLAFKLYAEGKTGWVVVIGTLL